MKVNKSLIRQSHFLGTKIRNLRKKHNLTIEDLSTRCIHVNAEYAPSVSYLSMIERGKRVPSADMLEVIGQVFQKDMSWFLDSANETEDIAPTKSNSGGLKGMTLEPGFLFSNDILQIALPELLSQTGTTSRQFAHLLIRAHQEHHQNHFPDLEKAAESLGNKRLDLTVNDLIDLARKVGISIKWFDQPSNPIIDITGARTNELITSYLVPPNKLFINSNLKEFPTRLKYELAAHIGHQVLHKPAQNDAKSILSVGGGQSHRAETTTKTIDDQAVNPQDIVQAWRDFESSFFAGALLCPKIPFRQLLERNGYEIDVHKQLEISPSVAMRRMTAVSNYKYWHYFDAYSPGKLKAVYRGNGIPLPWGNMKAVENPCHNWAVFRIASAPIEGSSAQLSIMKVGQQFRIYCCESINVQDIAQNSHVLCAGIDLNPAIEAQGNNSEELALELNQLCVNNAGQTIIPPSMKKQLMSVARILNINWVTRAIDNGARMICSQGGMCPNE